MIEASGVSSAARVGDYPLGSAESRAAARHMLDTLHASLVRVDLVCAVSRSRCLVPRVTYTTRTTEGAVMRSIQVPDGSTLEESLCIIGGFSDPELAKIAVEHPEQLTSGSWRLLRR